MVRRASLRAWLARFLFSLALVAAQPAAAQRGDYAGTLNHAFELLKAGSFTEAIPYAEQAVRLAENGKRENLARALVMLANLRSILGQFDQSEPLYKRAIALQEAALGTDHGDVANSLENLGRLYFETGRYDEAGQIFHRAQSVAQKAHPNLPYMWTTHLKNIADVHRIQGRPKEAEPLLERAVAIWEEQYGDNNPLLAQPLAELGNLYYSERRYAEAELLLLRAVELHEAHFNRNHPNFGRMLFTLASVHHAQRKPKLAEATFKRVLAIWRGSLSPDHPFIVEVLTHLASLYLDESQPTLALQHAQEATGILVRRGTRLAAGSLVARNMAGLSNAAVFGLHVLASHGAGPHPKAAEESFLAAQRARQTETARALSQMAERHFRTSGNLPGRIRERQDLERQWRAADKGLSTTLGSGDSKSAASARARMAALEKRLAEIDREIAQQFPDFASVTGAAQLSISQVQALLKHDEVLIQFLETPEIGSTAPETFVWLITPNAIQWEKLPIAKAEIAAKVAAIRCGLDEQQWEDEDGRARCAKLTTGTPRAIRALPFDLPKAHELFEVLLGRFKNRIEGKRLLLIPSETLAGIPLGVLVAEKGSHGLPVYANVKWLAAQNAIAILPSASSLQALRKLASASQGTHPFIGFGDPLLRGNASCGRASVPERCPSSRPDQDSEPAGSHRRAVSRMPLARFYSQRLANIDALQTQCPLPETAFELGCVAQSLGASATSIFLRDKATERAIKSLPLKDYRVVHFATHGLLAIETQQVSDGTVAEPALLLTPPLTPTEADDGLLTASEIMQLKLDADWIVLSACNTAGGANIASNEALSGLAAAFIYAGARALLVSHWAVNSNAAVHLTTRSFAELTRDPAIGRAEALRRSMLHLITNGAPYQTHPAYWAPFSIVGSP